MLTRPWNRNVIREKPRWALVVREQVIAAATLARAATMRRAAERPRFIVHSLGRSGSTLLSDLLDAHPQIECDGEILSHPLLFVSPDRFVRSRAALFPSVCYGFKLRPRHYADQNIADASSFVRTLHEEGWVIIHLERRNLLRIALSWVTRSHTRVVHRTVRDRHRPQRQYIPIPELLERLERAETDTLIEQRALADVPAIRLTYEDDLLGHDTQQATMNRLFSELGVGPAVVKSQFVRLSGDRLEDSVENAEEVRRALVGTRWERFLLDV